MKLHAHILLTQPADKLQILGLKDIHITHINIRPRQARETLRARGSRIRTNIRIHFPGVRTQQGRPARDVALGCPDGERLETRDRCGGAVVEHGVDEDLFREGRGEVAVARHEGHAGGDAAARALAEDGDAGWVDVEAGCVGLDVEEGGVDVFRGCWVRVFWSEAVVDAEGWDAVRGGGHGGDFGEHFRGAEDVASAVGVDDGGGGRGGGGMGCEVEIEDFEVGAIVGREFEGLLDEVFRDRYLLAEYAEHFGSVVTACFYVVNLGYRPGS